MADYAGAKVAIRARFEGAWTQTRITYQNEDPKLKHPELPWPPVDADALLLPWVNLEIIGSGSSIETFGPAGSRMWKYEGEINVHVYVPVNSADADATALALAAGEIFRAASFYLGPNGQRVTTLAPSIDDGDSGDDEGNWFRCSMSVDFTYWHRA